jgi:RhtB (resistance to homoserine/threonine) family protein
MGVHDFWIFVATGFLLNITPGPDMALIIARSTQQGTRAGLAAALGVGAGAFFHIAAAAIGISALLVTSAFAFTVLKWAGALYLVYIGVQTLRQSMRGSVPVAERQALPQPLALRRIFLQGALTNILNPKVAMFFLAFLPQFVDADAPNKVTAFVLLGLTFNVMGTAWNMGLALAAGRLALSEGFSQAKLWLERVLGAIFICLGVKLALAER